VTRALTHPETAGYCRPEHKRRHRTAASCVSVRRPRMRIAVPPEARRGESADARGAPTPCQLDGHPSARRVPGEMRSRQAMLIRIAFRRVHHVAINSRWTALDGWPAAVPGESRRVNIVMLGQQRNNVLPDAARPGCAMQQNQGRFF
jgi:hypothetical protein